MSRAQCLVCRDRQILMGRHRHQREEWWCLPGGGIEDGETPEQAALRELFEECGVRGKLLRPTSVVTYAPGDQHFTYWIDIGLQTPVMGRDPELASEQIIVDMAWIGLDELAERDRVYLWTAGLLAVPGFYAEISRWPGEPAYPGSPP
jgi:8-oxo-dGTP pyrophosphatase MutT (NUDIX family)